MTEFEEKTLKIEQEKAGHLKKIASEVSGIGFMLLLLLFLSCSQCISMDVISDNSNRIARHINK